MSEGEHHQHMMSGNTSVSQVGHCRTGAIISAKGSACSVELGAGYLDKLQVCESTHAEVRHVLEGRAGDLGDAPADRAAVWSALRAAQRCRAVEVAPV